MAAKLSLPQAAVVAMTTKSASQVMATFLAGKAIPKIDILTFGYLNTAITRTADEETLGYVTYWSEDWITVGRLTSGEVTLLGVEPWHHWPSPAECVALFEKYWSDL